MGRFKQLSIENELPDNESMYMISRVYIMNGSNLTREEFISQVALSLYINEPGTDIRKNIDLLLDGDMKELVCSGGDKFVSYIIKDENVPFEQRPLKSYDVSYDVVIKPLIFTIGKKLNYKRVTETITATSFKEAKELVRKRTQSEGKMTKSYEVVEVKLTEVRDPSK